MRQPFYRHFQLFYLPIKSQLLGMQLLFKHQNFYKIYKKFINIWSQIKTDMGNFQPLEVVERRSETQPQVVENLNKLTWWDKG